MHVLLSFLKSSSIGYPLWIVQWDFTRRDHPWNPGGGIRVGSCQLVLIFLSFILFYFILIYLIFLFRFSLISI